MRIPLKSIPFKSLSGIPFANTSSDYEASIEQLRGTAARRPLFFREISPTHEVEAEEEEVIEPRGSFYDQFQIPLEQRRKIPGCGINHHDIFDDAGSAETEPIQPKPANFEHRKVENLFDQFDRDPSASAMVGAEDFIKSHFQQQQYHGPRRERQPPRFRSRSIQFPPLSQLSTSSSSSSSSSSSDEDVPGNLRRLPASSFMSTPRRRIPSQPPYHHHNSMNSASQRGASCTPESSPSQSLDTTFQFIPLHTSTFLNQPGTSGSNQISTDYDNHSVTSQ